METIRIKALSGSAATASLSRPIKARRGSAGTPSARRSAFTLVELLVVIGIIAMLAALVTPAVMRAQATARNAAIKAEIDMLHMALMNYQSEYGVLPPCIDTIFPTAGEYTNGGQAAKHLKRLFPRCAEPAKQLNDVNRPNSGPIALTPINALPAWLSGFTNNPLSPLVPGSDRTKLYDFDKSRISASNASYYPSGKSGSPYIYFDSNSYGTLGAPTSFSDGTNTYVVQIQILADGSPPEVFNPGRFQILCAGRDEQWGTDDDMSNFWPGTRKEYSESKK